MKLRTFSKIFFTGLAAVLPIIITVSVLWWLGSGMERALGHAFRLVMPDHWYIPGMGLLAGLALTFLVGLLAHQILFRKLFVWWDQLLNRIPLVKTIYGAASDFMRFLSRDEKSQFDRVVLVEFETPPIRMMGFVTREDFSNLPAQLGEDDRVAVYVPLSYQIGGYTLFVPKDRLKPLDMKLENAMRFAITAGLSTSRKSGD